MAAAGVPPARALLRVVQARGAGYAASTHEELQTVKVGGGAVAWEAVGRWLDGG